MTIRSLWSAAVAVLVFSTPAAAQLYDGGPPDGGAGNDIFGDFRAADDFALASQARFDLIRFWGIRTDGLDAGYVPDIFWQILVDGGRAPGGVVAQGNTTATLTHRATLGSGFDSWQFDLVVQPLTLGAGVYWLALYDANPSSGTIWETSAGGRGSTFATEFIPMVPSDGNWNNGPFDGNLAFELGSVHVTPEPTTMALLGTGLAGIGALRRRRKPEEDAEA